VPGNADNIRVLPAVKDRNGKTTRIDPLTPRQFKHIFLWPAGINLAGFSNNFKERLKLCLFHPAKINHSRKMIIIFYIEFLTRKSNTGLKICPFLCITPEIVLR
jgi:hypothetical protein